MKAEAAAYLEKARESLAAAEADFDGGRYNAATARAYYAAFQASVAILTEHGVEPRGDAWDHRFVISEISGKLIRRRDALPTRHTGTLGALLVRRLRADYRPAGVGARDAKDSVEKAREFVHEIERKLVG